MKVSHFLLIFLSDTVNRIIYSVEKNSFKSITNTQKLSNENLQILSKQLASAYGFVPVDFDFGSNFTLFFGQKQPTS